MSDRRCRRERYNIVVTAPGFQKYQAKGVVLPVAQKLRVDIALTVGAVNEEIVVIRRERGAGGDAVVGHQFDHHRQAGESARTERTQLHAISHSGAGRGEPDRTG